MMDFEITELNRRLANMITLGVVAEADYEAALVRVQIGELLSAWLPWGVLRAGNDRTWWSPEVGEQVMVISPSGDPAQGIVLTALYQNEHPAPDNNPNIHKVIYKDGAAIEYDRENHHLKAVLPSGGTAELQADGGITIVGDITVEGAINVSKDVVVKGSVSAEKDVSADGSVSAQKDMTAKGSVSADMDVSAKGSVSADMNVSAKGSVSGNSGITAGGISLTKHIHSGCASNSVTGPPK